MRLLELIILIIGIYTFTYFTCIYIRLSEYISVNIKKKVKFKLKAQIFLFASLKIISYPFLNIMQKLNEGKARCIFSLFIDEIFSTQKNIKESIISATQLVLSDIK
jgi:hypothetical protein